MKFSSIPAFDHLDDTDPVSAKDDGIGVGGNGHHKKQKSSFRVAGNHEKSKGLVPIHGQPGSTGRIISACCSMEVSSVRKVIMVQILAMTASSGNGLHLHFISDPLRQPGLHKCRSQRKSTPNNKTISQGISRAVSHVMILP
jgi:hypothetical protein